MSGSTTHALKVSIFLPGRYARFDVAKRYQQILQRCPCCASSLVVLMDKFGDFGDGHVTTDDHVMSGGWYCNQCGLHLVPGEDVKLLSMAEKILPRTPTKSTSDLQNLLSGQHMRMSTEDADNLPTVTSKNVAEVQGTRRNQSKTNQDQDFSKLERQIQDQLGDFMSRIRNHHNQREQQLDEIQERLLERQRSLDVEEKKYLQRLVKLAEVEQKISRKEVPQDQSASSSRKERAIQTELRELESGYCSGYTTSSSQERDETPKVLESSKEADDHAVVISKFNRDSVVRHGVGHNTKRAQPYIYRYSTNSLTSNPNENALGGSDMRKADNTRINSGKENVPHKDVTFNVRSPSKERKRDDADLNQRKGGYRQERVSPPKGSSQPIQSRPTDKTITQGRSRSSSLDNILVSNHVRDRTPMKKDESRVFVSAEGSWLDVSPQIKSAKKPDRFKEETTQQNLSSSRHSQRNDHVPQTREGKSSKSFESLPLTNEGMTVREYMSRQISPHKKEHQLQANYLKTLSPENVSPRKVSPVKLGTTLNQRESGAIPLSQLRSRSSEGRLSANSTFITNPHVRGPKQDHESRYNSTLIENKRTVENREMKFSPRKELFPTRGLLVSPPDKNVQRRPLSGRRSRSAGQVVTAQAMSIPVHAEIKRSSSTDFLDKDTPAAHSSPNARIHDELIASGPGGKPKRHPAHLANHYTQVIHHKDARPPVVKPKPSVETRDAALERTSKFHSPDIKTHRTSRFDKTMFSQSGYTPQYQTARVNPDKTVQAITNEQSGVARHLQSRQIQTNTSLQQKPKQVQASSVSPKRQKIDPSRYQLYGQPLNSNNSNNNQTDQDLGLATSELPEDSQNVSFRPIKVIGKHRRRSQSVDAMRIDQLQTNDYLVNKDYLFKPIKMHSDNFLDDEVGTLL